MNSQIEQLFQKIAFEVYAVRPSEKWTKAVCCFQGITCMSDEICIFYLENGTKKGPPLGSDADNKFIELREEMAKINENKQAWYTATCNMTPDGKFKFDFDYDHLPAFNIIPNPDKWLDEFKTYPRPELQAQVQDWIDEKVEHEVVVERLAKFQQKDSSKDLIFLTGRNKNKGSTQPVQKK